MIAFVHGFSNRLSRDIVLLDTRKELLWITEFKPGYETQCNISFKAAAKKRRRVADSQQPLWLLMEPNHFSALLPSP